MFLHAHTRNVAKALQVGYKFAIASGLNREGKLLRESPHQSGSCYGKESIHLAYLGWHGIIYVLDKT